MESDMRRSGIDVVGKVPWGTHFCQFYETSQDLVETLVPYFERAWSLTSFACGSLLRRCRSDQADRGLARRRCRSLDNWLETARSRSSITASGIPDRAIRRMGLAGLG